MSRPSTKQIKALVASARSAIDNLELGVLDPKTGARSAVNIDELLRRAAEGMRDGYPTQSSLRGSSSAGTILDDEGEAMPPIADPVGELVADSIDGTGQRDRWREAADSVVNNLDQAVAHLTAAVGELLKIEPPPQVDEPRCVVHERHKFPPEDVYRNDRCRKCYDFWLVEKFDPPAKILRAWSDGRRLTPSLLARLLPRASSSRGTR